MTESSTPRATLHETTVPCGLCGTPTRMTGTKRCDRCWELESRIHGDPTLAAKILAACAQTPCKAVSGCRGSGEYAEQFFTCEECGDVTESMQCPRGRSKTTPSETPRSAIIEECAKMCEQFMPSRSAERLQLQRDTLENVAQAIRALKNAAPQVPASEAERQVSSPAVAATLGVACKYTKGRCMRELCNTVLCCQAEDARSARVHKRLAYEQAIRECTGSILSKYAADLIHKRATEIDEANNP